MLPHLLPIHCNKGIGGIACKARCVGEEMPESGLGGDITEDGFLFWVIANINYNIVESQCLSPPIIYR